jgi:hypothetical protein
MALRLTQALRNVLAESHRMVIRDVRIAAGNTETILHTHPTLRWKVGAPEDRPPTPAFFEVSVAE